MLVKNFILALIIAVSSFACQEQFVRGPGQDSNLGKIKLKNVSIEGLKFGSSAEKLITVLGPPDSIISQANEFTNGIYEQYHYNNSHFVVEDKLLAGFTIKDSKFPLDFKNLRVGLDSSTLKEIFPKSYQMASDNKIRVQIESSDQYLIFGVGNNKIVSIQIWSDL